jgi:hypothetical protein
MTTISSTSKRPFVLWVPAMLCILLLIAWLWACLSAWIAHKRNPYDDLPFNASQWKAAHTNTEKEVRAKMAGDILKHYFKVGMTEGQMTSLLGPPDDERDMGSDLPGIPPLKRVQYVMGKAWGGFGDNENLRAYFDEKGRCVLVNTEVD